MDEQNLANALRQLGIAPVAQETVHRACKHAPWVAKAAADAADLLQRHGMVSEVSAAAANIRTLLRAASETTAALLTQLGLETPVQTVYECACRNEQFFRWLAAYHKGNAAAGQRVTEALSCFAVQTQEHQVQTASPPEATQSPANLEGQESRPAAAVAVAPTGAAAGVDAQPVQRDDLPQLLVYGAKGAVAFDIDAQGGGNLALTVQAASPCRSDAYDWSNAIEMMLGFNEAVLVFAVLTGLLPGVETTSRGNGATAKRFKLDDHGGKFVLRMTRGQRMVAVPLLPLDALRLALHISNALVHAHPQLRDMDSVRAFVSPFIQRLSLPCAA